MLIWNLRALIGLLILGAATQALAGERLDSAQAQRFDGDPRCWYDIRALSLEGQGWSDTAAPYDRLPTRAEALVRPEVWSLSRNSAGLCVRFFADATELHVKWKLTSATLALPHMPATGVSGVDLYVRHEGQWMWLACGFPQAQENEAALIANLPPARREYRLYLPLYNGVSEVLLGVPDGAVLEKPDAYPEDRAQPIVFYGTSITQGGCASRPGMVHTAILGRRFERPVINLGFSGNGRMELPLAELLAELDAAVYVIDCLPNLDAAQVEERTEPLVQAIRAKRPATPILLVEDRSYSNAFLDLGKRTRNLTSRAALRAAYERLLSAGVTGLSYLEGEGLLGGDNEGTVDSSHPTDLGFFRQADAMEPAIAPLLEAR